MNRERILVGCLVSAVALAAFAAGNVAPKLKYAWAGEALNRERLVSDIELRCLKAEFRCELPSLNANWMVVRLETYLYENGLKAVVSVKETNLTATGLARARRTWPAAKEALVDLIYRRLLPGLKPSKASPIGDVQIVIIGHGGKEILGMRDRELGKDVGTRARIAW